MASAAQSQSTTVGGMVYIADRALTDRLLCGPLWFAACMQCALADAAARTQAGVARWMSNCRPPQGRWESDRARARRWRQRRAAACARHFGASGRGRERRSAGRLLRWAALWRVDAAGGSIVPRRKISGWERRWDARGGALAAQVRRGRRAPFSTAATLARARVGAADATPWRRSARRRPRHSTRRMCATGGGTWRASVHSSFFTPLAPFGRSPTRVHQARTPPWREPRPSQKPKGR